LNEIDHFKIFVICSGDVDHLHIKRIHLVGFSYIVIEDKFSPISQIQDKLHSNTGLHGLGAKKAD
jgi:hypothetical protein